MELKWGRSDPVAEEDASQRFPDIFGAALRLAKPKCGLIVVVRKYRVKLLVAVGDSWGETVDVERNLLSFAIVCGRNPRKIEGRR